MSITTEYITETVDRAGDSAQTDAPKSSSRLESIAFYVLLATVILAPLAFLPTPYIPLDAVKTTLIALGTIVSAVLYGVMAYKKRSISLPPRGVSWAAVAVIASIVISAIASIHPGKSFFGQGFELATASFSVLMFLVAIVTFAAIRTRMERVTMIYVGMAAAFIGLAGFHALRIVFGASFAKLGFLSGPTSTILGTWFDLATFSGVIAIIVIAALSMLPLSRRMKWLYVAMLVVAAIVAVLVNSASMWISFTLVLAFITIHQTLRRYQGGGFGAFMKSVAWLPLAVCIVSGLLMFKGATIVGPSIDRMSIAHTSLVLPWQISLDVAAGAIKDRPLFGIGPNQFSKAYIAYRPAYINNTYAWNAEFNQSFSLIATTVVAQGVVGAIAWGTLIIFLGILFVRALRSLPADSYTRFVIVSSTCGSTFLWIVSLVSVPSHVMLYMTYVVTAIALGSIVNAGIVRATVVVPTSGLRSKPVFNTALIVSVAVAVIWGSVYVKNAVALAYFGSGVKALNASGDPLAADSAFRTAQRLNPSDIYLQARVEAGITRANQLIAQANALPTGTTTQALVQEIGSVINASAGFAREAIALDDLNYYNYVSSARVLELATNIQMADAYDNAIKAYTEAIKINPLNPSLYLSLAQLQASQNKLDDALRSVGAAIQVKNDYLDAIFLLSQITAAQGNLKDAITAAQVGTEINPQSPVLFFQLGLLQYTNKDYTGAAKSLESAVKLQPDYANAQYFLGLSYARIGDTQNAIAQFDSLAKANPDNQEVQLILANLMAGKSPFADAKPPVTPTPEKRTTLPVKETKSGR